MILRSTLKVMVIGQRSGSSGQKILFCISFHNFGGNVCMAKATWI